MDAATLTLPEALLRLPSFLMFQLLRETRRLTAEQGDEGLRLPHLAILCSLAESGPSAQKAISTRLRIDPSDLVAFVDDLERAGLATRERDSTDRRRYLVTLTDAGRAARQRRLAASRRMDDTLLTALTATEREELRALLLRVYAHHDPDRVPEEFRGAV